MKGKALDFNQNNNGKENCAVWRAAGTAGATERLLYYREKIIVDGEEVEVERKTLTPGCEPVWDNIEYTHGHAGW
jgi:hypothetical protein